MQITRYSFGNIEIDGKSYTKDVIIYPDRVFSPWWRKEGHSLHKEDITDIVDANMPELIIGTGYYGAMQVPGEIINYLKSRDIKVYAYKTPQAVEFYNNRSPETAVIAALHLTC